MRGLLDTPFFLWDTNNMSSSKTPFLANSPSRRRFALKGFDRLPLFPKIVVIGILSLPLGYLGIFLRTLAELKLAPWQSISIRVISPLLCLLPGVLIVGGALGHYAMVIARGFNLVSTKHTPISRRAPKLVSSIDHTSSAKAYELKRSFAEISEKRFKTELLSLYYAILVGALMTMEGDMEKFFNHRQSLDAALREKYPELPSALQDGYFQYLDSINAFLALDREEPDASETTIETHYKRCLSLLTGAFLDSVGLPRDISQAGLQEIVRIIDEAFSFATIQASLFLDGKPLLAKL